MQNKLFGSLKRRSTSHETLNVYTGFDPVEFVHMLLYWSFVNVVFQFRGKDLFLYIVIYLLGIVVELKWQKHQRFENIGFGDT